MGARHITNSCRRSCCNSLHVARVPMALLMRMTDADTKWRNQHMRQHDSAGIFYSGCGGDLEAVTES